MAVHLIRILVLFLSVGLFSCTSTPSRLSVSEFLAVLERNEYNANEESIKLSKQKYLDKFRSELSPQERLQLAEDRELEMMLIQVDTIERAEKKARIKGMFDSLNNSIKKTTEATSPKRYRHDVYVW